MSTHGSRLDPKLREGIQSLLKCESVSETAIQLFNLETIINNDEIDINDWIDVIEKLDLLLLGLADRLPSLENSILDLSVKVHIKQFLIFLCRLLKGAKTDKRYFKSLQSLNKLILSYDIEIFELTVSVLYDATQPAASIMSSSEFDGVELEKELKYRVFRSFESLGFDSVNYGLIEYLQGHAPAQCLDSGGQAITYHLKRDAKATEGEPALDSVEALKFQISLDTSNQTVLQNDAHTLIHGLLASNAQPSQSVTTVDHKFDLLNASRSAKGLASTVDAKVRVIKLRIRCLLISVHTKADPAALLAYLHPNSSLLRDLLTLADISSDFMSTFKSDAKLALASLALECVTGLLRCGHRRKGSLLRIGLDRNLGLIPRSGHRNLSMPTFENIGGSNSVLWVSIVLAASSSLSAHFTDLTTSPPARNVDAPVSVRQPFESHDDNEFTPSMYLRIALELLATCFAMHDSYDLTADTPIVGAVAVLLQNGVTYMNTLLVQVSGDSADESLSSKPIVLTSDEKQNLWGVAKAFACLNACFGRANYQSAIIECDVLSVVESVVSTFSTLDLAAVYHCVGVAAEGVLDRALALLTLFVAHEGRRLVPASGESGMGIVKQQTFADLAKRVFQAPTSNTVGLWYRLLSLLRVAISR